jgi:Grx4 family monothiol glutaredoxin
LTAAAFKAAFTHPDLAGIDRVRCLSLIWSNHVRRSDNASTPPSPTNPVVLYMKGDARFPQCGFSATAVQILKVCGVNDFVTVNVLADEEIRNGVKEYANWPTIPAALHQGRIRRRLRHHEGDVSDRRTAEDAGRHCPSLIFRREAHFRLELGQRQRAAGASIGGAGDVYACGRDTESLAGFLRIDGSAGGEGCVKGFQRIHQGAIQGIAGFVLAGVNLDQWRVINNGFIHAVRPRDMFLLRRGAEK